MRRSHGHEIIAARFPHLTYQDLPFYLLNIAILKKYAHHEKLEKYLFDDNPVHMVVLQLRIMIGSF